MKIFLKVISFSVFILLLPVVMFSFLTSFSSYNNASYTNYDFEANADTGGVGSGGGGGGCQGSNCCAG